MKTENSCEFVDLLYIVVYILDEIKFSFTEKIFFSTKFSLVQKVKARATFLNAVAFNFLY